MAFEEDQKRGFWKRTIGVLKVFGVILAVVLGLGAFWALAEYGGPRASDPDDIVLASPEDPEMVAMMEESLALEEAFRKAVEADMVSETDITSMKKAIQIQAEYNERMGGFYAPGSERLRELEDLLQDTMGQRLFAESRDDEMRAVKLEGEEDYAGALRAYEAALKTQRHINEDYPLSDARNINREARLERLVDKYLARPYYVRSTEAEEAADKALEAEDWKAVQEHLTEAIEYQQRINLEYRNVQYASIGRLEALTRRRASLASTDLQVEIEEAVAKANTLEEEQRFRDAAEQFQIAQSLQERLNREYPQSMHHSRQRIEELRDRREKALSQELANEIISEQTKVDALLRKSNIFAASERLSSLYRKAERFRENFPRSTILDEQFMLKLQFLNFVQQDLKLIHERVYGQLLRVPDYQDVYMSRIEVSQALFESLMGHNPSRNAGELRPVDSVNWRESNEFCQRLGYALGREVRLPTRNEHRSAVGRLRYADLDAISWNASNSGLDTHPVGSREPSPAGFYDVLGNVAEWVADPDLGDSETQLLAGGSILTSLDEIAEVPYEESPRRERSRTVGFRYVVILPDWKPARE